MLEDMEDDITMAPLMKNLHAFDWVCKTVLELDRDHPRRMAHTRYQGPSGPCKAEIIEKDPDGIEIKHICGQPTVMDVVWMRSLRRNPPLIASTARCISNIGRN